MKVISAEIIKISSLPYYWSLKIAKWSCPYCGRNKLIKRKNADGNYKECVKCGRVYQ